MKRFAVNVAVSLSDDGEALSRMVSRLSDRADWVFPLDEAKDRSSMIRLSVEGGASILVWVPPSRTNAPVAEVLVSTGISPHLMGDVYASVPCDGINWVKFRELYKMSGPNFIYLDRMDLLDQHARGVRTWSELGPEAREFVQDVKDASSMISLPNRQSRIFMVGTGPDDGDVVLLD